MKFICHSFKNHIRKIPTLCQADYLIISSKCCIMAPSRDVVSCLLYLVASAGTREVDHFLYDLEHRSVFYVLRSDFEIRGFSRCLCDDRVISTNTSSTTTTTGQSD